MMKMSYPTEYNLESCTTFVDSREMIGRWAENDALHSSKSQTLVILLLFFQHIVKHKQAQINCGCGRPHLHPSKHLS